MIKLEIEALPENVAMARVVASSFITKFDPTVEQLTEFKTAVSEAVTNAIIHGYSDKRSGEFVTLTLSAKGREITAKIIDNGVGIEDVEAAKEPLFTTKPEMERSGLGFTVMESFMSKVEINSKKGEGTTITLVKELGEQQ
ncbi:MAG: anti-sigma F factor [Defluviitaleaceae bacterium]|nr:anti-sigma F factor [Defluviitaleaceae bacterium]